MCRLLPWRINHYTLAQITLLAGTKERPKIIRNHDQSKFELIINDNRGTTNTSVVSDSELEIKDKVSLLNE